MPGYTGWWCFSQDQWPVVFPLCSQVKSVIELNHVIGLHQCRSKYSIVTHNHHNYLTIV